MSAPHFCHRFFRCVLGLAVGSMTGTGVRAASETMAERTLRELIGRQQVLLADAVRAGDNTLDQQSVRVQLTQLEHDYQLLIDTSPDFAEAYADYGYLLSKMRQREQAMKMLLRADQIDGTIAMVKNQLGNLLAEDGKPLEAINYFEAAARLEPNEPLYPYQIGSLLYFGRDRFLGPGGYSRPQWDEKMHGAFRRAAELAPDRIEFTYRYAESFADLAAPDWEEAFRTWSTLAARSNKPLDRAVITLQQANVRLKQGRVADARALLAGVTTPELQAQKEKLVAQLPENAKK